MHTINNTDKTKKKKQYDSDGREAQTSRSESVQKNTKMPEDGSLEL